MRQPFLSPDSALAFAGALLLLSVAFTHIIRELASLVLSFFLLPGSWMSDESKPDPVLLALVRIEASMAVFTTELATVITRLDQLQRSFGCDARQLAAFLIGAADGFGGGLVLV